MRLKRYKIKPTLILGILLVCVSIFSIFRATYIFVRLSGTETRGVTSEKDFYAHNINNCLVVGLDKKAYDFIDFAGIVSIDRVNKDFKIFVFDPKFFLKRDPEMANTVVTIRNHIAVSQAKSGETDYKSLKTDVSRLLGMRVDCYVSLEKETIEKAMEYVGGVYVSGIAEGYDYDNNFEIKNGMWVDSGNIHDFLAVDTTGNDSKNVRHIKLIDGAFTKLSWRQLFLSDISKLKETMELTDTDLSNEYLQSIAIGNMFEKYDITLKYLRETNGYLSSNGNYYTPVYETINQEIRDIFELQDVKLEQKRVDVINGSEISGLASRRRRWLQNVGVDVVFVGNQDERIEQNLLYVGSETDYDATLDAIIRNLNSDVEVKYQDYPGKQIGDIVLVLGTNESY